VALGIASAVASANPEAIAAGAIGGMDMAEKTLLKYSRTYESSADQAAFKLLEKSGNSAVGLQKLLQYFMVENRAYDIDKYLLTHPISNERLSTVNQFLTDF
jgi:predicted Zn-dependent protease